MSKYRFKTKEEFIRDELWEEKYNCPDEWSWKGKMNKYLGMDVPDEFNSYCNKKEDFEYDGWHFSKNDYVLKEQQEYFDDLSQHIGRYIRALVDNPHSGFSVKKGDVGKIISYGEIDFPNHKAYNCTRALDKNNLGTKYELLPEDYSPEQENVPERISFYVKYTEEFTEDLYNALWEWSKKNSEFSPRGFSDSYEGLKRNKFYIFDNWTLNCHGKYGGTSSNKFSYGVDNNKQNCEEQYTIEQVKRLIGYKEPSLEFIPGKWYKYNRWYIKYKDHVDDVWRSSEQIDSCKKYSQQEGKFGDRDSDDKKVLLIDLSEIQQYLPEGHPDKIKNFKLEPGKWYSFNWDWSGKDHIVVAKIKEVTEKDFIISWRSYLWNDNDYNDSDGYFFKDISNIKELSIEEVQPYLPNGHPDKIINQKFEIGKWYKWYQKNHGKYHFGKVERINTETDTVVMLPWIIGCTDYNYSGYFDLSKAEQIQEISVEEVQEFLPKNHSDKITSDVFKKGEYIVITDNYSGGFCTNYIYKQRKDYTYLEAELDNNDSRTNGFARYEKKNPYNWRYATQEEIDEYERRGKPYDVTELQKKKLSMKEIQEECKKRFPIGCTFIAVGSCMHRILEEDSLTYSIVGKQIWAHDCAGWLYGDGKWAELVSLPEENITEIPEYVECIEYFSSDCRGKIYNTTLDKPEKSSTNTWYQILIDCGRLKDGSFKISNKEAYEQQKPLTHESVSGCFPTDKKIFIHDEVRQYPLTPSECWKNIPKFEEQKEFDIYGPTPDIN